MFGTKSRGVRVCIICLTLAESIPVSGKLVERMSRLYTHSFYNQPLSMYVNKAAVIVLGLSLLALLGAILAFGVGLNQSSSGLDVEEYAIFQGDQGTVEITAYSSYSVYVNSDFSCSDTTVSVYDEEWEYFYKECEPIMNEQGWDMIGYFVPDVDGQLTVEANHEIAIIDDMVYLRKGGGSILISGGLACLGIVGVIIGLVILVMSKPKETQQELEIPPIENWDTYQK